MGWTKEQKQAIEAEGTDILVAAGAGSGKTAVLVNRIVRKVLDGKENVNIDDLLVVTFTRPAAAEMRSRISAAFDKKMSEAEDPAAVRRIYDQQVRLSRSWITTIDGFCKRVLCENVRESGIDSSWGVCDPSLSEKLLEKAVSDAAEEFSSLRPEDYSALADVYGDSYSDKELLGYEMDAVKFSLSFPDPEGWLQSCLDFYNEPFPDGDFAKTAYGKWLTSLIRIRFEAVRLELENLRSVSDANGFENYKLTLDEDIDIVKNLQNVINKDLPWAESFECCSKLTFPRLKSLSGSQKEGFDEITLELAESVQKRRRQALGSIKNQIVAKLFQGSAALADEDRLKVRSETESFVSVALRASELFRAAKKQRRLYDYGDMEHMCLELFKDPSGTAPSPLALTYRRKFSEIYVDEYQDTNMLQESILKLISGTGREVPHVFMVGDMKQSIYSFRNACPELFTEKYMTFTENDDGDSAPRSGGSSSQNGRLIRLNANFRSRREVIDSVNETFAKLMDPVTCGMPYGPNEYLNYGANCYGGEDGDRYDTEIVLVEEKGGGRTEAETAEIIGRIRKMKEEGFTVYDKDEKRERPVRYGDICILLRAMSPNGRKITELIRKSGIPVKSTDDSSNLFLQPEVRQMTSFLRIIDNPLNDIPLFSVLKNVYGFSADLFASVKIAVPDKDICFYERLKKYAEAEEAPGSGTVRAFLSRLSYLRDQSYLRPAAEILWLCLEENGFLSAVEAQPDGGSGYANLMKLVRVASDFDASGGSFCEFVRLTDVYEEKKGVDTSPPPGSVQDAVTVSTIHKSKGLEYPVVFLAEAGRKRSNKSENPALLMHKELGLGPVCFDRRSRTAYPSIMKEAIKLRIARDARAEELRLLYVAMTRAREKLIITASCASSDRFMKECAQRIDFDSQRPLDHFVLLADSYISLIGMASESYFGKSTFKVTVSGKDHAPDSIGSADEGGEPGEPDQSDGQGGEDVSFRFGLPNVGLWYPSRVKKAVGDEPLCPSKVSVSEVKRIAELGAAGDEGESGQRIGNLQDRRTVLKSFGGSEAENKAALSGTLLHCCLEHIDFKAAAEAGKDERTAGKYALSLIKELVSRGFFSEEDALSVPTDILTGFIRSDFAKELSGDNIILREIPFAMDAPSDELFGVSEFAGNITTVQGVIDCIALSDGKVTLIDYKSDTVPDRDFEKHSGRYRVQLGIYSRVCEKMFGKKPDAIILFYLKYAKRYELKGEAE